MCKVFLTAAAVLAMTGMVWAGGTQINTNTKKVGKQSITTLEPVKAPPVTGKKFDDASAEGVVLQARDWICGTQFTDQENRRWKLVYGPSLREKPDNVPGWVIHTKNNHTFFMTTGGSLFCLTRSPVVAKGK